MSNPVLDTLLGTLWYNRAARPRLNCRLQICSSSVVCRRLQAAGYRSQVAGFKLQVAGCRLQVAGYRLGKALLSPCLLSSCHLVTHHTLRNTFYALRFTVFAKERSMKRTDDDLANIPLPIPGISRELPIG